jgi:transposase
MPQYGVATNADMLGYPGVHPSGTALPRDDTGTWVLGRPRHRPACMLGDRGYDAKAIRQGLRARHILPLLAKRNTEHGSGLGRWRWVVERTFAWLNQFRRLRIRYEKRADVHEAFLNLACALLCWNFLDRHLRKSDRVSELYRVIAPARPKVEG